MELDDLASMLRALDGVRQDPHYHPEGDALTHTLQVFDHARRHTEDPVLIAAALLHDVGKAIAGRDHDREGASLLDGLVHPRIVYLVEHHLELLRAPGVARKRLRGSPELRDLELLRRYDVGGRVPGASAPSLREALAFLEDASHDIAPPEGAESDDTRTH